MEAIDLIFAVAKKETRQLRRDKRLLLVIFFFPLFLLIIFGYAINLDVKHIRLAVYDQEKSKTTRQLVQSLVSSDYFDLVADLSSYAEVKKYLDKNEVQLVVVIPPTFSNDFYKERGAKLQFLIDGVNGNTANIVYNYSQAFTSRYLQKFAQKVRIETTNIQFQNLIPFELEPRFWFNPDLKSSRFLVPGLIGIIIILTSAISVALSVVREKERNSIEQIYVSPISLHYFIIGKIIPYIVIAFANSLFIIILGNLIFDVSIQGSIFFLLVAILLYIYSSVSIGIFVSTVATTQLLAFLMAVIFSVLPSLLFSGFIFPIESMPIAIQILTNITPAKFFLSIIRGILLRGVGFEYMWSQYIYLICYGTIFVIFSIVRETYNRRRFR